ncbi:hypothetical protein Pst134EA_025754 [Puccinia striiformis f. sp. tritici]|uniref:hypothetical protein n=1 Tax=Puccinia striiformis f. sp. tritici TaxID=168172 RepID=UPI00200858DB|nr:hypothetical protein Pst134EA_025754 [Puccinia striiformis f. sp. tritici]KAH9451817.1 hypothetical protein Pst134EA_025754 [Puccinia striiformis f. sp. tritici]
MQSNYNTNGGTGQQPQQYYQSQHRGRTASELSLEPRRYHGFDQNPNLLGHQPPLQRIIDTTSQQRQHTTPAIPAPNGYLNSNCRPAVARQGPWPGAGDIHRHVPTPHSQPRTLSLANIIGRPPNFSPSAPHPLPSLASPSSTQPNSIPYIAVSGHPALDLGMGSGVSHIESTRRDDVVEVSLDSSPPDGPPPAVDVVPTTSNNLSLNHVNSSSPCNIIKAPTAIRLTDDATMAEFERKSLKELRDLQRTHVTYKRLNLPIKFEAENLYFDYQKKQHLLSLKYQRPFKALTKYLGQRRTRQKTSSWHTFMKEDPSAQVALHNTKNNIGQRNKDASQIYKQRDTTAPGEPTDTEAATLNPSTDPNAEERSRFGKIFKSEEKIRAGLKEWAKDVQLKLKELSDSYGVEGFLVLAAQDHRKPFFFQGGSLLGDEYLRGLVAEEDPIRKFAVWVAGAKKLSKKRKITGSLLVEADATRAVNSGTATEDLNVPVPVVAAQPPRQKD